MLTITKKDYLKRCVVGLDVIKDKAWYYSAFTLPVLKETSIEGRRELELLTTPTGLHTLLLNEGTLELAKIVDATKNEPLYKWKDEIEIDPTWLPNVSSKLVTNLGRLFINAIVLVSNVGGTIPYLNKPKFKVSNLEKHITDRTVDLPEAPKGYITVKQMVDCINAISFFSFIATFTNVAATPKSVSKAPGADEYRNNLLAKYGDTIKDPVVLTEYLDELAKFDENYLKGDPFYEAMYNKKVRASRSKTYYTYGQGLDFVSNANNLMKSSLAEGINSEPVELSKMFNDIRYASFSRGSNTALAGYTYKILQRALTSISISNVPCTTKKGLIKEIAVNEGKSLVGRSIKRNDRWVTISNVEEATTLEGKVIELRSTMYCTSPGNTVCYACMSEHYKNQEFAVTNISANLSSVLLTAFLKLMHGIVTTSNEIELKDLCS